MLSVNLGLKPPPPPKKNCIQVTYFIFMRRGKNRAIGIATRYSLDGPGIESRWGRDFPHSSRLALEPTQPPIQWVPGHFPGGKAAGAWRWLTTQSSVEVKEKVELYIYSPYGPSWAVLCWALPCLSPLPIFMRIDSVTVIQWTSCNWPHDLHLHCIASYFMLFY